MGGPSQAGKAGTKTGYLTSASRASITTGMNANVSFLSKNIQLWSPDRLVPYSRNARQHSAEQISQIAASIREFGFTNPILVDSAAGVVAGHARLAAALQLSLPEVPVIVLDHLSEVQKRAYILADNKLAENASWNQELLHLEIEALKLEEFDVSLVGFSDPELDQLLRDFECPDVVDEDSCPEPNVSTTTRFGELWTLGRASSALWRCHRSRRLRSLTRRRIAGMIFTDPPYNVNYESDSRPIANDNLGSGFEAFLDQVCANLLNACQGAIYICMSSSELGTLQRSLHPSRWPLVYFSHLVEEHVSRWAALTTSASRSPSSMAGGRAQATIGAELGIRAMSGLSPSLSKTICIRL